MDIPCIGVIKSHRLVIVILPFHRHERKENRARLRRRLDGDGSLAGALVGLGGDDLVVVVAEGHAGALPGLEDGAHADGAAGAVLVADGPVLLEGLGAINRGLLVTSGLVQAVGRAGVLDRAAGLGLGAGVVLAAFAESAFFFSSSSCLLFFFSQTDQIKLTASQ